ncbi:hypothetical protein [Nonomuraea cavernae]|uniref:hypothetical protein n=1 Tax=Nonomuraea cavernae TaxID=2045107 RepID=UPI0033F869EE
MTRRRRREVHRRPVVLFAALLAPAIFAGGLLAGELGRFQQAEVRREVNAGAGGRLPLEPVLLPAPSRPDRRYKGLVPAFVPPAPSPTPSPVLTPMPTPMPMPTLGVRASPTAPVPVSREEPVQREECAGEWEDTWLWEVCKDRERAPAQKATASASLPGLLGLSSGGRRSSAERGAR